MVSRTGRTIHHPSYRHPIAGIIKERHETLRFRVPICILCSLVTTPKWSHQDRKIWSAELGHEQECELERSQSSLSGRLFRFRCLNCKRPMRVYSWWSRAYWVKTRTCCTDCEQAILSRRNNDRRRVQSTVAICVECRRKFSARKGAVTCSNRCRQARFRRRTA
jgi:hypothetical protein